MEFLSDRTVQWLITTAIAVTSPEGIPATLSVEESRKVVFTPIGMNDDDVVTARVLLTSPNNRPDVTGHILGVRKIRDYE